MMSRMTLVMGGIWAVLGVACAASPGMQSNPHGGGTAKGAPVVDIPRETKPTTALPTDAKPEDTKTTATGENTPEEAAKTSGVDAVVAPPPPPHPITGAPTDPLAGPGGNPTARGAATTTTARQGDTSAQEPDGIPVEAGIYGGVVPSAKPKTVQATSEVRGSIDRDEIRRVVMAHTNDVKQCYDQGLKRQPGLEGRVVLKFVVGKTGVPLGVTVQQTSLNDRQVEQCMAGAAKKWTFPKPKGEGDVSFVYPFILKSGA